MNDKLTPDELVVINQYFEHDKQSVVNNLMRHIAAVEAERDEATALLREMVKPEHYEQRCMETPTECLYCGAIYDYATGNGYIQHAPDCVIPEARTWLAKVESEMP